MLRIAKDPHKARCFGTERSNAVIQKRLSGSHIFIKTPQSRNLFPTHPRPGVSAGNLHGGSLISNSYASENEHVSYDFWSKEEEPSFLFTEDREKILKKEEVLVMPNNIRQTETVLGGISVAN